MQFISIAPTFFSLQLLVEAVSNISMLDVIKVAQEPKETYWTLLIAIIAMCYLMFILVGMIYFNLDQFLSKISLMQKLLQFMNDVYLPFVGNTMFLPITALLLDAFVCDKEA